MRGRQGAKDAALGISYLSSRPHVSISFFLNFQYQIYNEEVVQALKTQSWYVADMEVGRAYYTCSARSSESCGATKETRRGTP